MAIEDLGEPLTAAYSSAEPRRNPVVEPDGSRHAAFHDLTGMVAKLLGR